MVDLDTPLEEILASRQPGIKLFGVFMKPTPMMLEKRGTPEMDEMRRQAFVYIWQLEEQKKLLLAGPFEEGTPNQEGMMLLMVDTLEEAESIAAKEPMHAGGWRVNTVRSFALNEGLVVDTVRGLIEAAG
ncbi:MAG: YciI family protein [Candidatus Rariloculaceae bacterium]